MSERLHVLQHHLERVRYWDDTHLTPQEVAKIHLRMWNTSITAEPQFKYPETPEFIDGLSRIIESYRNGVEIIPLDDFNDDRTLDPMCKACMQCPNPIRDLQLRLQGFEKLIDP